MDRPQKLNHSDLCSSLAPQMLCSSSIRILSRRSLTASGISATLRLAKQFSSTFLQISSPPSSFLLSVKTGFSHSSSSSPIPSSRRPLFYPVRSDSTMASHSKKEQGSIHDFTVKDARGNDVDLSTYKGKVLLVVNVASQCGLTNSNYTELNNLYEKYKNQGLEILAFPCNQFGEQEPGSNEQILEFACTRFKAEFPIFDKVDVNGDTAAPVYKFMKSSKGGLFGDNIKWNFSKFLVDKDGHVVDRYAPTTTPLSIEKDLKKLLGVS